MLQLSDLHGEQVCHQDMAKVSAHYVAAPRHLFVQRDKHAATNVEMLMYSLLIPYSAS